MNAGSAKSPKLGVQAATKIYHTASGDLLALDRCSLDVHANYGHLHVTFDDGSVGWYEAGWGPMMSETAYFVKDVVGPKGAVSIVAGQTASNAAELAEVSNSADIDRHTKTDALKIHYAEVDGDKNFKKPDEIVSMEDEPGHQELCDREQAFFLRAIREDLDLSEQMDAAVNSLRIVLAAEQSIEEGRTIELA
jgi:predicted dehydrogenase